RSREPPAAPPGGGARQPGSGRPGLLSSGKHAAKCGRTSGFVHPPVSTWTPPLVCCKIAAGRRENLASIRIVNAGLSCARAGLSRKPPSNLAQQQQPPESRNARKTIMRRLSAEADGSRQLSTVSPFPPLISLPLARTPVRVLRRGFDRSRSP